MNNDDDRNKIDELEQTPDMVEYIIIKTSNSITNDLKLKVKIMTVMIRPSVIDSVLNCLKMGIP